MDHADEKEAVKGQKGKVGGKETLPKGSGKKGKKGLGGKALGKESLGKGKNTGKGKAEEPSLGKGKAEQPSRGKALGKGKAEEPSLGKGKAEEPSLGKGKGDGEKNEKGKGKPKGSKGKFFMAKGKGKAKGPEEGGQHEKKKVEAKPPVPVFSENNPPTISSGYGKVPNCPDPTAAITKHETVVRDYLKRCNKEDVLGQIRAATKNKYFNQFQSSLNRKFGSLEDLVEFEAWLAKMVLSQAVYDKALGNPQGENGLGSESPEKQEEYRQYWNKYKVSNATSPASSNGSQPSASASPTSPSVSFATPECKKPMVPEGSPEEKSDRPTPRPGILRKSTSMHSDGTGPVEMEPLGDGSKHSKRVKLLTPEDAARVEAMTSIEDLSPPERKRQREALRRRMNQPGLRPGLLQKFSAATTSQAKWEFLKAFMLDPTSLSSITVESEWVSLARKEDESQWTERPLCQLRKTFTSEAEKRFLEKIISEQKGRAHPQAPLDEEMKLYWVFEQRTDKTTNRSDISNKLRASGDVPRNKAALGAMVDTVTGAAADFHGGKGEMSNDMGDTKGGGNRKGGRKGGAKGGAKGGDKGDQPRKEIKKKVLTAAQQERKDFDTKIEQTQKLATKARATAKRLKDTGMQHQEAVISNLGQIYQRLSEVVKTVSDMIFDSTEFILCQSELEKHETEIQDACRVVQEADSIIESHDRRIAAEKRKAEAKANPKAKAKNSAKKRKTAPKAEDPPAEEWPEDEWLDGEEDDDDDPEEIDGDPFDSDENL